LTCYIPPTQLANADPAIAFQTKRPRSFFTWLALPIPCIRPIAGAAGPGLSSLSAGVTTAGA